MSNINYHQLNRNNWIGMISGAFCFIYGIFAPAAIKVSTDLPIFSFSRDNYFKHRIM